MSSSFIYTNIIKNIDSLLFVSIVMLDQTTIHDFIDKNNFMSINKGKRRLLKINFLVENVIII